MAASTCTRCDSPIDHQLTGGNTGHCRACRNADSASRYSALDYKAKLLYPARQRAKKKGLECTITKDDIVLNKVCPLLGIEIDYSADKVANSSKDASRANSPSLDRIDSSKGYIPGNVWVISKRANTIKSDATLEELALIAKNLKRFLS